MNGSWLPDPVPTCLTAFVIRVDSSPLPPAALSEAAKELNRIKSVIRASIEYVFGSMIMSMGGKLTKIALERTMPGWDSRILLLAFLRDLQHTSDIYTYG